MQELNVALIGFGLGGRSFHAPIIASTAGMHLGLVVTSDAERAAQARTEHPRARVVARADEVWERARDIDLVVVSTPNRTHVPLALAALDAGIHVVVDKPLAPSAREARLVALEAERRALLLVPYHNRRWDGDFLTLRRLLRENSLGPVHRFESRFERWRPAARPGWRESSAPEDAGGLLYDIGTHLIDQAIALFGPVTSVYAELRCLRLNVQADDDVFVALRHASGVQSHLWTSLLSASEGPRFRVLGRAASYTKHGLDVQEDALRRGARPGAVEWGVEAPEHWGVLDSGEQSQRIETEAGTYQAFYADMVLAIRTGAEPPVKVADAIAGLEVIEAAQRSSQRSGVVTVDATERG